MKSEVVRKHYKVCSAVLFAVLTLLWSGVSEVRAQTEAPKPEATPVVKKDAEVTPVTRKDEAKPSFKLSVSEENVLSISLNAENTKLSDIAADLSHKLKIPVILSPVMARQRTGAKFSDLLLEPAMQLLAPVVYIDYEIESAPGSKPRPLGIFLNAYNEIPPASNAVVKGKSQAFVISGNTETTPDEANDDDPIKLSYKNGNLTIKAKDQPLLDVMSDIADEAGIPFEGPEESKEQVSVNIKDRPLEDAILQISPNLRIYVRFDSQRGTRTVLRIVVVERTKNP